MWNVTTKYGYLDKIWCRLPVFFHGEIVGFYINSGIVYVCKSTKGSLLHVREEDIKLPKKHEELKRSL